jgi:hypothetical protein
MPFSAEEFYAGAMRIADPEGRLPLSRMAGWEVFPFDQDGLRVVPLEPPSLPEPARDGEGGNSAGLAPRGGRLPGRTTTGGFRYWGHLAYRSS